MKNVTVNKPGFGNGPRRKGTLMIALMVVLLVMGIVAANLVPDSTTIAQRRNEQSLKTELAGIRSAIDLERFCSEFSSTPSLCQPEVTSLTNDLLNGNPSNPYLVASYLQVLSEKGKFLRGTNIGDALVIPEKWNLEKNYWEARINLLQASSPMGASSFETGFARNQSENTIATMVWQDWLDNNLATSAIATYDWPTMTDAGLDDYHGQNKMGTLLGFQGKSLKLKKLP